MYINYHRTTGQCIAFAYAFLGSGVTTLQLLAIKEDRSETTIDVLQPLPDAQISADGVWFYYRKELPRGINMIMIVGERGSNGSSGVALDDIEVKECNLFRGEAKCYELVHV